MSENIDFVIKLGGSAITHKDNFETLKNDELHMAAELLQKCVNLGLRFLVVHGAGSFGHHQAKNYSVNNGYYKLEGGTAAPDDRSEEDRHMVQVGFCKTRQSVQKLNQLVCDVFLSHGLLAVQESPCSSWKTENGKVIQDGIPYLTHLIRDAFIPVVHGDCVLDKRLGCRVLSGDTIITEFCRKVLPKRVIFLTDVAGIFNMPPTQEGSQCLREILVNPGDGTHTAIKTSKTNNDVTGGMSLKLSSAVHIVRLTGGQTSVFVCQIGSQAATNACLYGELRDQIGTIVKNCDASPR